MVTIVEQNARILVVEDEPDLNRMIVDFLTSRGFACESALDGSDALVRFFRSPPDLVVLDINLPNIDGMEVARTIRTAQQTPIIMLTARAEEEDTLLGFDLGIDDYLVKPASLKVLAARISAVLRRSAGGETDEKEQHIVRGPLLLNHEKQIVYKRGTPLHLTAAQFAILEALMRHPGRVFSRMQLLEQFQDHAFAGYERTIDVHIKNIRKQVEDDPANPVFVETVWGSGYRFAEGLSA